MAARRLDSEPSVGDFWCLSSHSLLGDQCAHAPLSGEATRNLAHCPPPFNCFVLKLAPLSCVSLLHGSPNSSNSSTTTRKNQTDFSGFFLTASCKRSVPSSVPVCPPEAQKRLSARDPISYHLGSFFRRTVHKMGGTTSMRSELPVAGGIQGASDVCCEMELRGC